MMTSGESQLPGAPLLVSEAAVSQSVVAGSCMCSPVRNAGSWAPPQTYRNGNSGRGPRDLGSHRPPGPSEAHL